MQHISYTFILDDHTAKVWERNIVTDVGESAIILCFAYGFSATSCEFNHVLRPNEIIKTYQSHIEGPKEYGHVESRYQYGECKMKIFSVKESDFGTWKCKINLSPVHGGSQTGFFVIRKPSKEIFICTI